MTAASRLPTLVQQYLARALPVEAPPPKQVRLTQVGEMVKQPGARAMRFTATERFAIDRVAFAWDARFPIAPLISINVTDGYADGAGILRVRALGIPMQRRSGPDVTVSEAMRYLAELAWVPQAMIANGELEWRAVDERQVEVALRVRDQRPTVRLEFDASGDIVGSSADARPREVDGRYVPTGWGGTFSHYDTFAHVRLPTRAEVYWDLPEGRFVYWRGRISSVEAVDERFGP